VPNCSTAIAQAETGYEERDGVLYTVRFEVEGGGYLSIATTRPELIPACQAIMVNPQDQRYTHLMGKRVKVPFTERYVNVLQDQEVDTPLRDGCGHGV